MRTTRRERYRAWPAFGLVLGIGLGMAFSPLVPSVGAVDPSPSDAGASASPDPAPTPTLDPTPDPTVDPPVEPTAEPGPTPTLDPDPSPEPLPTPAATATPDPTPTPTAVPAAALRVEHVWVDALDDARVAVVPGALDAPRSEVERFRVYVIRFQLVNGGDAGISVSPVLEVGTGLVPLYAVVPAVDPVAGRPFYVASDNGRRFEIRTTPIEAGALRLPASSDPLAAPVAGISSWGLNPLGSLDLPAHSFTEIEFAVRATADAAWLESFRFRLSDSESATEGPAAELTMRSKPAVTLSPNARSGTDVGGPVAYPLDLAAFLAARDRVASTLAKEVAALIPYELQAAPAAPFVSPHGSFTLTSDTCAACHSSHTARGPMLTNQAPPQAELCFSCHDGSGAGSNVKAQYLDPAVPANDPATSRYYSHPATDATALNHVTDRDDEFGGRLERHASCADCHQPHIADASLAAQTTGGWTASGALAGAAGVSVVNGGAGASPTYTLVKTSELEYQLCFKCHSGWTQLPGQDPANPSRWALDVGVEFNPANASYHPVEAQGTNQRVRMEASLDGSSPYKLWSFDTTSTIRCLNCHGDSRLANPASPPPAGARLAPHAVPNAAMLILPYRNGDLVGTSSASGLKPAIQAYNAADSALCYACHAEEPFVDAGGDPLPTSYFRFHGLHTFSLQGHGTGGRDIDVDGDGQGNALCAECHFRTHSTAFAVDGQPQAQRLVNFSPNVQPYLGVIAYDPTAKSCTLTCHGKAHPGLGY